MASNNAHRRTSSNRNLWQIIIYLLLISAVILGLFFIISNQSPTVSSSSTLTFRITGSARSAVITYTKPDGSITEPTSVNVPWESRAMRFPSGTIVVLTAALTAEETGTIKCIILSSNKIVNENMMDPFKDKAVCGAVTK